MFVPLGSKSSGTGPPTVEVYLMDEDKDWDDIYASVGKNIEYNPGRDRRRSGY